jgi:cytochrome c biogenesis protein CcdA/thiol-disulfide isomerase/thioredoxin
MLLLLISFIAGVLTILAPCVLPVLPIIIGGSLAGDSKQKSRPYIIVGALAGSIIAFTLLLKVSTSLVNLSPSVLTDFSGGLIIALGAVSLVPELWERAMVRLNWEAASQRFLGKGQKNKGKYAGPILIGIALGPVFSSCSPTYAFILASVLPRDFLSGLIYLITYAAALVVALLLVALLGRKFISRFGWAVNTHSLFRRAVGVLFVVVGIVIISGNQVRVETWIANHLPFDEGHLEQTLLASQQKPLAPKLASSGAYGNVLNVQPTPAPEFAGLSNWINSPPLTMAGLRGKVVLVDFWTYSCVNCNRALPYVEKWYQAYKKDGLVVVGVHTPEFAFEHNPANVQKFVESAGITYPVALDNNEYTWDAFNNDSWPADYLIDQTGNIRYVALGEGNYNITEEAIQTLLGINSPLQTPVSVVPISSDQTPETYLGSNRQSGFSGKSSQTSNGEYTFTPTATDQIPQNGWTLSGDWQFSPEAITSESAGSTITFKAEAKDIYIVAGSASNQPKTASLSLLGGLAGQYGPDAPGGNLVISGSRLYHIVSLQQFGPATLSLKLPAGVSLYTFTFGS